jgi:hypothetical protein
MRRGKPICDDIQSIGSNEYNKYVHEFKVERDNVLALAALQTSATKVYICLVYHPILLYLPCRLYRLRVLENILRVELRLDFAQPGQVAGPVLIRSHVTRELRVEVVGISTPVAFLHMARYRVHEAVYQIDARGRAVGVPRRRGELEKPELVSVHVRRGRSAGSADDTRVGVTVDVHLEPPRRASGLARILQNVIGK